MNLSVTPIGVSMCTSTFSVLSETATSVLDPSLSSADPRLVTPLPVPERRWRDVFMNYVDPLLASTFMSVTYHYVLIFIDCLIKMRYLVLTAIMKVEEVT